MTRLTASILALVTLVPAVGAAQPAPAQVGNVPAGCVQVAAPVYDMARRYIPGTTVIRSCPTFTIDVTTGPNAIKPGEVLSATLGRYQYKQPFLVRGRPNVAYPLAATRVGDVAAGHVSDGAYYPLEGLGRALPFQPTEILEITGMEEGQTWYGYSGLRMVPGRAAEALPLDGNSVVLAIDGFNFHQPNAFLGLLAQPNPIAGQRRHVEVVYFQKNDPSHALRHALIPTADRAAFEPGWSNLAATNGAFQPQIDRRVKLAGMFLLLSGAAKAFAESEAGRAWLAEQRRCQQERQYDLTILSC